jgi:hypothetical protein
MLAGALAGCCTVLAAQDGPGDQEVGRTTEREVKVVISCAFGHLKVCRGEPEKIVVAETGGSDSAPMHLSYTVRNRIGYLDVTLGESSDGEKKHGVFRVQNIEAGTWTLRFGDAIPISFDIEQGVGKGEYDLSGLQVKDFTLNNGASDVVLMFDEPNPSVIENLSIESGVSKFSGVHLGNANFKRFRFQGGVGSSTLDFSGALRRTWISNSPSVPSRFWFPRKRERACSTTKGGCPASITTGILRRQETASTPLTITPPRAAG